VIPRMQQNLMETSTRDSSRYIFKNRFSLKISHCLARLQATWILKREGDKKRK